MLVAYVVGFTEGVCAHVVDLVSGGVHAYQAFAPPAVRVFFVSLVILDPLVVVLVARVRRAGVRLASGVMLLDVAANWVVDWQWLRVDPGWLWQPVGLLPITVFGVFVLATAVPLARVLGPARRSAPAPFVV